MIDRKSGVAALLLVMGSAANAQTSAPVSVSTAPAMCATLEDGRVDTPEALVAGWLGALSGQAVFEIMRSRHPLSHQVVHVSCADQSERGQGLCELRRAARRLFANPERGEGGRLYRTDGRSVESGQIEAFFDFSVGDAYPFRIACPPAARSDEEEVAETEPDPRPSGRFELERTPWTVARTLTSLVTETLDTRDFATFSWTGDREAGSDTYSIDLAIGAPRRWRRPASASPAAYYDLRPALSYSRSASSTPASSDVNDLGFWLIGGYFYRTTGRTARELTGRVGYLTDDQFESRVLSAELRAYAPLSRPRYYGYFQSLAEFGDRGLEALWRLDLVMDYLHVGDPGEKPKLAASAEYWRWGGDLEVRLQLIDMNDRENKSAVWTADFLYQVRDGLAEDGGDAQMFRASLNYHPVASSNFRVGLIYERGETLLSFADVEKWTFGVGFRY